MTERVPITCNCHFCGEELTRQVLKNENGVIIDHDYNGKLYIGNHNTKGIYVCDSCRSELHEENERRIAPEWAAREGYPQLGSYFHRPKQLEFDSDAELIRYRSVTACLGFLERILDDLCPWISTEGCPDERSNPDGPQALDEVLFLYELRDAVKSFIAEQDDVDWWRLVDDIDFVAMNILYNAMCRLYLKEKNSRACLDNQLRKILEQGITTLNLVEKINTYQS